MFSMLQVTALAHFVAGHYVEALTWAERAFRHQSNSLATIRLMAASNAMSGRLAEAQRAIARCQALDPDLRLSNLKDRVGPYRPEDFERYVMGLRLAGLPA
jgi:Flp pilus assembly protein TadD